ncbi:MAG: ABC transporter ATP-binding protein [Proteobacteria bacterium]|nr:ABC transporter ATP-binding protein [Pseudomonadota bacterium]
MANTSSPLRKLFNYSRQYRRTAIQASCFSIANKFFDVAPEILIGVAVDVVVRQEESFLTKFGLIDARSQIVALAVLTMIIWICESLFEYLYSIKWQNLAQFVQHDLRMDAYAHLQKLGLSYFEDKNSGSVTSILNDDINQLERFLNNGANALLQVASAVVFIGSVFFFIAPDIAFVAITPIPFIIWGTAYFRRRSEPLYANVREKAGLTAGRLQANISGIATIKAFGSEDFEAKSIRTASQEYVEANKEAIRVNSAFTPIIRMAILVGFVATLIMGAFKTLNGEIAVGSFGILVFLTQRLLWPFTTLSQVVDQYQRAMASCDRVLGLLNTPSPITEGKITVEKSTAKGAISIQNLCFGYDQRPPLFRNFTLTIQPGKTVAIVGPTGSGKSTLAKLILHLLEPNSGTIFIDGTALADFTNQSLRKIVGYVSQDIYLFSDSIKNNISYSLQGADSQNIISAAKLAAADQFIKEMPEKYETMVGERGQRLSGGQRQRIGLARALLRDPKILILDEATSAVDNETERLIQESMEEIRKDRTVIVIAHRLTTIKNADEIIVLDDGNVVETGRHETLLNAKGLYYRLWNAQ